MMRRQPPKPRWYQEPWLWVIIATLIIGITGIIFSAVNFTHHSNSSSNTTTTAITQSKPKFTFDGKTFHSPKYDIKINKVSVQSDAEESKDQDVIFDYTVHNKSSKDVNADSAWQRSFQVFQPTKNTENPLKIGYIHDDSADSDQEIRKGGTAHAKFAYSLKNTHTPVLLKAYDDEQNVIGKHKYKIKPSAVKQPSSSDNTSAPSNNRGVTKKAATNNQPSKKANASADSSSSNKNNPDYKGAMYENVSDAEKQAYLDWQIKWQNMSPQEQQQYVDGTKQAPTWNGQ